MTNKSKKLVLAFIALILLFVGCVGTSLGYPISAQKSQNEGCPQIDIEGPANKLAHPDESLTFAANKESSDWEYHWSTASGAFSDNFSDAQAMETTFTVPKDIETVKIMLTVIMNSACEETAEFEISIVPDTLPDTPVNAVADVSTDTPTVTLTAIPTATTEPTATMTTEPTATASATPVPTVTAVPTNPSPPTVTALPTINDPIITQLESIAGAVQIAWSWDGKLSSTQNFAVRFWSVDDPRPEARFSITWTKDYSYQFGVNSTDFPIGTYYINVAVMEGPSDGVHYEVARSKDLPVFVDPPPIPPTPDVP